MGVLFTNNGTTTLASSITDVATTLNVAPGTGSFFPAPTGSDWFPLTVVDGAGNMEVMKCTARAADALTVERGQEGTTALAFTAGSRVDHRLTAGALTASLADRQQHFATLADLKAAPASQFRNGEYVTVWGRATAGDGCDGRYRYHTGDMSSTFVRQTISVLTGEIDAATNKINKTAHGLWTGQACIVDGGDGLTANNVVYYIRGRLPNEFTLHPSFVDAVSNTNIVDITGTTAFSMKLLADPDQAALVVLNGKALDGAEGGFIHRDVGKHRKWRVEWYPSSGPDDTDQIMRAVLAAGEGKRVKFSEDTLVISDRDGDNVCLWRLSGQKWEGVDEDTSIIQLSSSVTAVQYVVRDADGAEHCTFEKLCFDGNRDNITPVGVDLYSHFNLLVGPDGGAHNRWRDLKLINSWGRTLQTGYEAGSNNTVDSIVERVIVRNAGTKAISLTENIGGVVRDCDVEVNCYTDAENPGGGSAGSGSCFESNGSHDVVFECNRGKHVGATVKGPGIRIINGGSNVKALKNWIDGAYYIGFIQNCDDVEFAHNTGRNSVGIAILIADDDTANPTDGCNRIRVHGNTIIDPGGPYVSVTANKSGYAVSVEAYIYGNDFIKTPTGSPTHGIYNNGVQAPATGGTCKVYQWSNNFVGGVPNEIAGPADFEVMPSPDASWVIVDQSSVPVSHTGNTSETILDTISILPHHKGKNGRTRYTVVYDYTNSANNKIPRIRFGGSQAFAATVTTTAQLRVQIEIGNQNATNLQSIQVAGVSSGWGTTTTAASTLAIDTTAPVTVTITGQLANSGETITRVSYLIEAYHEN